MVIFLGQTLFVTSFGLKTSGHSRTKDRNWPFIMFRLSMSFGKMCLLIFRSIYFWYCLYLFAICKWEVEHWFSCFEWFSFFFALFKKSKVWSKNVLGQFLKGSHSMEVPGLSQLLELGLTELELSHRCLVLQSILQLVTVIDDDIC